MVATESSPRKGPLAGVRVIEMEAIGPVPWAGMMLADMGADVLRVDRPQAAGMGLSDDTAFQCTSRGKRSTQADVKTSVGRDLVLELVDRADLLIEGLRPGVMERLGLGPDACLARNPALVYGRMTGWGQTGPLAQDVGHDINYIGIAGALNAIGAADRPPSVPLNFIGDFGGGGMLLVAGVLAALHEARSSGRGQVVDAAMIDGTLSMMGPMLSRWQAGAWKDSRESNVLDGGAHFYRSYETSDHRFVAVGAIEPRFYAALVAGLDLDSAALPLQHDKGAWPGMCDRLAAIFRTRTRDEWCAHFGGTEACVTPLLGFAELAAHPHLTARSSFIKVGGVLQPAPAPRFSGIPYETSPPPIEPALDSDAAVQSWSRRDVHMPPGAPSTNRGG